MGSEVIIDQGTPEPNNRYTWMKPMPDGSVEFYELSGADSWVKVFTLPKSYSPTGVTGSKFIPGLGTLTFTNGLLTSFVPA